MSMGNRYDRTLKGQVVEKVEHQTTKRVGVLRLHKPSMTFFARENDNEVDEPPFKSKDGREVRNWLLEQLARTTAANNLDWLPVVKITHGGTESHRYRDMEEFNGESLEVEFDRFFIALTNDQREWRKLPWSSCDPESSTMLADEQRYAASNKYAEGPKSPNLSSYNRPFQLPHFEGRKDGEVVLRWTPELWEGLLKIVKQIRAARKLIATTVGTKDGLAELTALGAAKKQFLLSPGIKQ